MNIDEEKFHREFCDYFGQLCYGVQISVRDTTDINMIVELGEQLKGICDDRKEELINEFKKKYIDK